MHYNFIIIIDELIKGVFTTTEGSRITASYTLVLSLINIFIFPFDITIYII